MRILIFMSALMAGCTLIPAGFDKSRAVSPVFDVMSLTAPNGALTELAATAFMHENKAIVCAAASGGGEAWLARVLGSATVYINGEPIQAGLGFGAAYPEAGDLTGKDAFCAETQSPWKPDYSGAKARVAVELKSE